MEPQKLSASQHQSSQRLVLSRSLLLGQFHCARKRDVKVIAMKMVGFQAVHAAVRPSLTAQEARP